METRTQELTEAALRYPLGAGKVSGVDMRGAFGFCFGTNTEQHPDDLFPVRAFRVGIKKAQIQFQVRSVIGRERCSAGRLIEKVLLGHHAPLGQMYPF
tara:strand:+ start:1145 stop:1438 length:294 start_codon:yes stop_codon:yes gene_type:complete